MGFYDLQTNLTISNYLLIYVYISHIQNVRLDLDREEDLTPPLCPPCQLVAALLIKTKPFQNKYIYSIIYFISHVH